MTLKPAKKKAATEKPLTDFFGKTQPKPAATARKVSGSSKASGNSAASKSKAPAKKAPAKKTVVSDDDISMDDEPPVVPKRAEAPRRTARAAPKTYIDISDDDDGGSGSEFEDFD